jgi:hypothetical protein
VNHESRARATPFIDVDTYKTAPPAGSESNDASVLLSLVFKC